MEMRSYLLVVQDGRGPLPAGADAALVRQLQEMGFLGVRATRAALATKSSGAPLNFIK